MSSNDTATILSRLSLAPAGSFVVYDAGSGWCFTVHLDELHEAHVADIAVGAHPYAAVTLSHDEPMEGLVSLAGDISPGDYLPADRDDISIVDVLADWMEWCDDVMEADADDERTMHENVIEAMRNTWRVTLADGDLAAINAAA